jgi:acyl carrier protein phosphodiesterase
MNYLAHLFLSDRTPHGLVGNLLGDFVKGTDLHMFPDDVRRGILLHRQIDSFTDRHLVVHRSISRISRVWGWFSGIIIDVYFDHLLARRWRRYSPVPLRRFADGVYQVLEDYRDLLPDDAKAPLARIIATDRLFSYTRLDGITAALESISQRIRDRMPRRQVHLEEALPDLRAAQDELSADFDEFFPELIAFADKRKLTVPPATATLNPLLPPPVISAR